MGYDKTEEYIKAVFEEFENLWGKLDNECGGYINSDMNWFSLKDVVTTMKEVAYNFDIEI